MSDFSFIDGGSVCVLRPLTDAAQAWVDDNVAVPDWQSPSYVAIERRFVPAILEGIEAAGLEVARG